MAGYTRQDTSNNIANGKVIDADDFDAEYNALEAAFNATTGHSHDGSAGEGEPITKVGPSQDLVVSATALTPKATNTLDLGTASIQYKDAYFDGTIDTDILSVSDTATIGSTLGVTGVLTASAGLVGNVTGTVSDVSNHDTGDITEGSNLYYTDARARSAVSATGSLNYNTVTGVFSFTQGSTDTVSEGSSNLYYTTARATADAKAAISVVDDGGDGSLTYSNGVITYTGASPSQVRTHFSGGTGVDISSGVVSIGQPVATNSNVTFGNATISGNLTVNGTTTTVNSNTVHIGDNIITLNSDETGTPSQDAGFAVHRGTSTNVQFIWDESVNRWSTDGQPLQASSFVGPLTGNASTATSATSATTAATLATARTISLGGDLSGSASFNGSSNITITGAVVNDSHTHTMATISDVSATATEVNKLDGFTGSATDLNYANSLRATGVTSTEFDHLDGVTSSIQTQLNSKYVAATQTTGTWQAGTGGTASLVSPAQVAASARLNSPVKAWVSFSGSNGSIRGSAGVASVTRHGAGDYSVNFASGVMSDANYASIAMGSEIGNPPMCNVSLVSQTSSACRVRARTEYIGTPTDPSIVNVTFMR